MEEREEGQSQQGESLCDGEEGERERGAEMETRREERGGGRQGRR